VERLSYRPISLDDFEHGAEHERDTEMLGGPVSIYASIQDK
jgi:hypothetical protein